MAITVKLTTAELVNDLVSVGETVAGAAIGGAGAALPGFIAELLERFGVRGATYTFPVIDWELPGYRVRLSVTLAGVTYSLEGEKCDGPAGTWELRGTVSGIPGFPPMAGVARIELDEHSLRGPMDLVWRTPSGATQIAASGRARFVEGDPPTLVIEGQRTTGTFRTNLGIIRVPVPGGRGIPDVLPLEVGRCEVVEVEG